MMKPGWLIHYSKLRIRVSTFILTLTWTSKEKCSTNHHYRNYERSSNAHPNNLQSADNAIKSKTLRRVQTRIKTTIWNNGCLFVKWDGNGFERFSSRVSLSGLHIHNKALLVGYAKFINAILKMKSCYGFGPQCGAQQLQQLSLLHFETKKKKHIHARTHLDRAGERDKEAEKKRQTTRFIGTHNFCWAHDQYAL